MNTHDTPSTSGDRISNGVNDTRTDIERIVMRRVHLIRILQLVISTAVLTILTSVAALWGIGREVWVANVFQNAPVNFSDLPHFYFDAFAHTRFIVQVLTILTLVSLLYLAREVARLTLTTFRR